MQFMGGTINPKAAFYFTMLIIVVTALIVLSSSRRPDPMTSIMSFSEENKLKTLFKAKRNQFESLRTMSMKDAATQFFIGSKDSESDGLSIDRILNSCIALTGGVELRVIRSNYRGGDNGTTYSSKDVDQYLAVIDRTARTYSFVKYEQNSSGTSTPLIHDSTYILISYRSNNGVIISVVSQKRNAFPFVSVQGNDTSFKLITETTDDILHGLRLQFPRANFNLEKNRTYGGF